jgi:hypothetical protein
MAAPQFRPLGFGEILDGAFTMYRRNFVPFLVTALIPTLVIGVVFAVFGAAVFTTPRDPNDFQGAMAAGLTMIALSLVAGLISLVLWGALTRESAQAYLGRPVSLSDGMGTAFRKLITLLLAGVVAFALLMVAYFAVGVVGVVGGIVVAIGVGVGSTVVAVVLGLVVGVLAIGGFLALVAMLFATVPAIIVEDKGPIQAISRSFDLARGAVARVAGVIVVSFIIAYLPMIAVLWLSGTFASMANPGAVPSLGQFLTQQLLSGAVGILTTPFLVSVVVLLYFDRRVRTEALDVQMMTDRLAGAAI